MRNYKLMAFLLLLIFCTSIFIPVPAAYAASLTGDSDKSVFNTIIGVLFVQLLNKLFHLNMEVPQSIPAKTIPGQKEVLGFYAEWWGADTSSYNDLVKHKDSIDTIAPFWATLHGDGTVTDRGGNVHATVVKYAHDNKIAALLLVNNDKQGSPLPEIHSILANPAVRETAINNLEAYIKKYRLDGINVDFEMVPASDRNNMTAFIRELSARLKPQGYIITIDVFPKHNEENDVAVAYDYVQLAKYVDKIILMTYDYHAAWNGPGAIADIRSLETDLKYALTMIPKNKILLGIAGYGYDWSSKGVESLEYGAIQNLIDRFGSPVQWDDASKSPHFSYTGSDGINHQVWYENSQSLKYKLDLVNKYDIAGIALWKLGEEAQGYWQVIKNNLK